jgi:hypothetical protein
VPPSLPPSISADILVNDNVAKERLMATSESIANFDSRNADSGHGDSEDYFVPSMRGGASKPLEHEVGLVTSIIRY